MRHVEQSHSHEIWNAHSLYTSKLSDEFYEIKMFLLKYPNEFVIIDLNGGWYGMNSFMWRLLKDQINRLVST